MANGRAAGTDGCNRVSVPYTQNGERITFGPMIATRMACPGSDDVQRRFAGALAGTTGWRIAGGRLEFHGATGKPLATFAVRPAAATPPAVAAPLKSKVFDWASLAASPIPNGERRAVLDGPTETSGFPARPRHDARPGQGQRPAGAAPAGRSADHQGRRGRGVARRRHPDGRPGSILFFAAGAVTGLRNVGSTPATYYVVYYKTPEDTEVLRATPNSQPCML